MDTLTQHKKLLSHAFAEFEDAGVVVDKCSYPIYSPAGNYCFFRLYSKVGPFTDVPIRCTFQEMDELYRFAEELREKQKGPLESNGRK